MSETRETVELPLVGDLRRELRRDPKGPRVAALLGRFTTEQDQWRRYVAFDPSKYTRNLVACSELFELLILCWSPGQRSPIHDHQGQRCWMAVLEGDIEEAQYPMPVEDTPAPMRPCARKAFTTGEVAFITDDIGLHDIGASAGKPAISLHLYAGPISTCRSFDPRTGVFGTCQLSYDTIDGRPASRSAEKK